MADIEGATGIQGATGIEGATGINSETGNNEGNSSSSNSDDTSKYLKLISGKISEDFDDDTPLLSEIKDKKNTCSKEYAINNIDIYKEEELTIDLKFNDDYDLNHDGKITEEEIEYLETIFDDYDGKSILDKIIENLNTCSEEYKDSHPNYEEFEGLTWPHEEKNILGITKIIDKFEKDYDINGDGKITQKDYDDACKIIDLNNKLINRSKGTLLSSLSSLPELPSSISDSLKSIMDVLSEKLKLTTVNNQNIENINPLSDEALNDFKTYYMNICSREYATNHPNYKNEGLKVASTQYDRNALNAYDINKDGKLTQEDYDLAVAAKAKAMNLFDVIYDMCLSLHKVNTNLGSSSYLNDKKLFFRECILRLFVNTNFDYNSRPTRIVINECLQKSKLFVDEVFNTKV